MSPIPLGEGVPAGTKFLRVDQEFLLSADKHILVPVNLVKRINDEYIHDRKASVLPSSRSISTDSVRSSS